ncbi:MAG: AAA family ATPase [Candidatus Cloacimonetes bacterium]|nr:AAA family ATPase [Candidatus Cloacimonadota bacterium]
MFISKATYNILNIDLIWSEINPISVLGQKWKKEVEPFTKGMENDVHYEFSLTEQLFKILQKSPQFYEDLSLIFSHLENISLIIQNIETTKVLEIFELQEIKNFIFFYQRFRKIIVENNIQDKFFFPNLTEIFNLLDPENQNSPVFFISDLYDENFAIKRHKIFDIKIKKKHLFGKLLQEAQNELNLDLPIEKIVVSRYNSVLLEKLQDSKYYHLESENFANLHFVITKNSEIVRIEQDINSDFLELMKLGKKIREEITLEILPYKKTILEIIEDISHFDWLLAKAYFGLQNGCTIPEIIEENRIEIKSACNLPIYWKLKNDKIDFQKIDISFSKKLNVITGANMAGKTTILKTVGQILFMAAYTIPVPAKNAMIPLIDSIYFSGIQANRMDLSSFGSEIVSLNNAIKLYGFSVFLIDEFARGTNPQEGEAFSKAILEHLSKKNCLVLFATHFNAPSTLKESAHYQIVGLSQQNYKKLHIDDNQILSKRLEELHKYMDYSLIHLNSKAKVPQAALMIAEILGIDKEIIESAKKYLMDIN